MRCQLCICILLVLGCTVNNVVTAQSLTNYIDSSILNSGKVLTRIESRMQAVNQDFDRATNKYVNKLLRQEQKLKAVLAKKDSLLTKDLFDGIEKKYQKLISSDLNTTLPVNAYWGHLDSLVNITSFLKNVKAGAISDPSKYNLALAQMNELQSKIGRSEQINSFIAARQRMLTEQLQRLGMTRYLKRFNKEFQYYKTQVNDIRNIVNDPDKLEQKLLQLASSMPAFQSFFANNSQIASLFVLPGRSTTDPATPGKMVQGLQDRSKVYATFNEKAGNAGAMPGEGMQLKIDEAQAQVQSLQNKLSALMDGSFGNGNPEETAPVKINNQRSKPLGKRIEWGFNLQSQRATNYFPSRSDVGVYVGYKLTNDFTSGLGASYIIGWGTGFRNINITHQGVGIRSFAEYRIKGNFHASAGFEMNYKNQIEKIEVLKTFSNWQQSGLIGLTKKYKVGRTLRGNAQLLWDFLSYQQIPKSQPFLFRIGYSIK